MTALVALALVWGGLVWWFRRLGRVQGARKRGLFAFWMIGGAALAAGALAQAERWPEVVFAGLALAGAGFALFAVWRTRPGADGVVAVGATIPPFRALDEHGEVVESASLLGAPLLLKFFRGHW